jgi:predicted membrane channel-forming protein YqfA (hemolysin III family)
MGLWMVAQMMVTMVTMMVIVMTMKILSQNPLKLPLIALLGVPFSTAWLVHLTALPRAMTSVQPPLLPTRLV